MFEVRKANIYAGQRIFLNPKEVETEFFNAVSEQASPISSEFFKAVFSLLEEAAKLDNETEKKIFVWSTKEYRPLLFFFTVIHSANLKTVLDVAISRIYEAKGRCPTDWINDKFLHETLGELIKLHSGLAFGFKKLIRESGLKTVSLFTVLLIVMTCLDKIKAMDKVEDELHVIWQNWQDNNGKNDKKSE